MSLAEQEDSAEESAGKALALANLKRAVHFNLEDPLLVDLQTRGFAKLGPVVERTQSDGTVIELFESVQFMNGYNAAQFVAALKEQIALKYGVKKNAELFPGTVAKVAHWGSEALVMSRNVTDTRIGDFNISVVGYSYTSIFYWWWDYSMMYQDLSWNNNDGSTLADSVSFQLFHKEIAHPAQTAQASLWDPERTSTVIVKNWASGYSDFTAFTEDWHFDYLGKTIADQSTGDFDYAVVTITEESEAISYRVDSSGWIVVPN